MAFFYFILLYHSDHHGGDHGEEHENEHFEPDYEDDDGHHDEGFHGGGGGGGDRGGGEERHETAEASEVDHMLPQGYVDQEHHRLDDRIHHEVGSFFFIIYIQ